MIGGPENFSEQQCYLNKRLDDSNSQIQIDFLTKHQSGTVMTIASWKTTFLCKRGFLLTSMLLWALPSLSDMCGPTSQVCCLGKSVVRVLKKGIQPGFCWSEVLHLIS